LSRPRKPTAVLELNGAFKHDPARGEARKHEPKPEGPLGAPPASLEDGEIECWGELSASAGWLTNADRWVVELAVCLMAKKRECGIGGRHGISVGELAQLNQCLREMGLTPVARSKVAAPKKDNKQENPFSKVAAKAASTGTAVN
jgi:hypothetical protein